METWNVEKLPDILRDKVKKSIWNQITVGESGAYTYLLSDEKEQNTYLKIVPNIIKKSMDNEIKLLNWLEGKLPVPKVLLYEKDMEYEYLLMSEVKGICSFDVSLGRDIPRVVELLAKGLRMIHSIDISDCPISQNLNIKIKEAEYRTKRGLVAEDEFDDIRYGRKATDLYRELLDTRPDTEDLVLTHGDYCLPNILIDSWEIGGFIDWGSGGISDRYQDLALASRSLIYNFGERWVPLLFEKYGLENINYAKIKYYRLLDEFF